MISERPSGEPEIVQTHQNTVKNRANSRFIVAHLLRAIHEGGYPRSIAKDLGWTPQRLNYHVRKLERHGYIEKKVLSSIAIYVLTRKGKKFLDGHVESKNGMLPRFHHFALAYDIVGGSLDGFLPLSRGSQLKHGVVVVDGEVDFEDDKFHVRRFHSPSSDQLFLYGPPRVGWSPWELIVEQSILLDRLANYLASRHGFLLGEHRILQRPEFAFERDPFAKFWGSLTGANVKNGDGAIDRSEGDWEVEFCNPQDVEDYLKMPSRLERIASSMDVFADGMHEHMKLIANLQELVAQLARIANGLLDRANGHRV